MKKPPPHITGGLAEKAYWYQLHVFQVCQLVICVIPSLLVLLLVTPMLRAFMQGGPLIWYMTILKLVVVVPFVFLFGAFAYLAFLLAAVFAVVVIRLLIPELRMPDARSILLQFYSDPRWLYQSAGSKHFSSVSSWIFLWRGMGNNKRLNRWCRRLAAATIALVYGRQEGAARSRG